MESGKDQDTPGLLSPPMLLRPMMKQSQLTPFNIANPNSFPQDACRSSFRPEEELEKLLTSSPAGDGFDFDYYCVLGFVYSPALSPSVAPLFNHPFPLRKSISA